MRGERLLHLIHHDADCDALGSAYTLSRVLPGEIGTADGMKTSAADLAGWLEIEPLINPDPQDFEYVIIHDTYLGELLGMPLPPRYALIDHHITGGHRFFKGQNQLQAGAEWHWVQPLESTCSLLFELLGAQQKASSELGMLSAAVRHADEAIVILQQDGRIAWVNPAYERSRDVKNADLLGCRPNDVVKGCDDPATHLAIWAAARVGKTWKGRLRTVVGDGRVVTEDVVVSPVLHAGQTEPGGYVMLMHDVSEQIALEAQIAQTQRLEVVEQLAAGVAHEINTPAQYVDGNVRFLEEAFSALSGLLGKISDQACAAGDGALSAADISALLAEAEVDYLKTEVPVAIRQTLEGVGRISSIVQSMKELTDPAPDFVPANLNPIIEGAVIAARNEWADVAEFRMQLDPQLPWVPCQPESINQVVVNMLANAAQAIAGNRTAAPGHVVVSTCSAGDGVEISISDDGAGMTPFVQARIFDPFYTTRPVGEGTGQGLSTARSVIRKHGGTIAVDSAPGRGSCFRIHLPLADGQLASGGDQDSQLLRDTRRLAS